MIRQYKLREINKNDQLHKEIFVTYGDCMDMLEMFIKLSIEAGADKDKLMELFADKKETLN